MDFLKENTSLSEKRLERLKKWKKGKKAYPFALDINPTDRCNLNCKSCWQRDPKFDDISSKYELSREKLLEVVDQAIDLNVVKFEITGGGEPLIRKDLVLDLMEKIKEVGKYGNLTTNGTLFEKSDLRFLTEIGWDKITISLDGPNSKINDYLRGKNSFEKIIKNIKQLNRIKKGDKPALKFNTVISNKNYNKLSEMIELASQSKAKTVSFETLTVHSQEGEKLKLNKDQRNELEENIPKLKEKADKLEIETNIGSLRQKYFEKSNEMEPLIKKENEFSSIACYEPWYHLVIKVDGSAQPCCLYDSKEENVKNKSLKKIWFGDFFQKIRKNIKQNNFSKYCQICNASQVITNKHLRQKLKNS